MPPVLRRKPSPRLSGILAACDPTSEVSSNPAARRSIPYNEATPELPPRVRGLPRRQLVTEVASPCSQGWSQRLKAYQVVLAGRATSLLFTTVLAGPKRTTTDNATAASTCAVHCWRR